MTDSHRGEAGTGALAREQGAAAIVSVGADVDVRALVEEIQAEVARKAEAGLYPPELLMDIEASQDPLGASLIAMRDAARFSSVAPTASGRAHLSVAVAMVKRLIAKGLGWHTRWLLDQVHTFAANAVSVSSATADSLRRQDRALSEVRGQVNRLQHRVRDLDGRALPARADGGAAAANPAARSRQVDQELDYLDFENRFRGSRELIADRQAAYLELFRGAPGRVVDLGCGRGEFLDLLRRDGVGAYGVDMSHAMLAACRERGLEVRQGDVTDHLAGVAPGSLGGVFCAHVLEHLDPADVIRFFGLAWTALAKGGVLVVETLNPQSLATFTNALYVDLGHLRPLHPYTLTYLAEAAGLQEVEVRYSTPVPPEARLKGLPATDDPRLQSLVSLLNENLHRLDEVLFGAQDFAVVARR